MPLESHHMPQAGSDCSCRPVDGPVLSDGVPAQCPGGGVAHAQRQGRMEPDYRSDHSMLPVWTFSPSCLTLLFPSLLPPGITPGSLPSPRQGRGPSRRTERRNSHSVLSKERENKILGDKLSLTTNIHVNKPNADPGQELPQEIKSAQSSQNWVIL